MSDRERLDVDDEGGLGSGAEDEVTSVAGTEKALDGDDVLFVDAEYVSIQTVWSAVDLKVMSRLESDIERQPSR